MELERETVLPSVPPCHSKQLRSFFLMWVLKISHMDFRLTLVRILLAPALRKRNVPSPIGWPPAEATEEKIINYKKCGAPFLKKETFTFETLPVT
jgi:hypothetical protein